MKYKQDEVRRPPTRYERCGVIMLADAGVSTTLCRACKQCTDMSDMSDAVLSCWQTLVYQHCAAPAHSVRIDQPMFQYNMGSQKIY